MTDQLKELRALVDYALERGITVGEANSRKREFHRKVGPETVQALLAGLDAARAEGRRSRGEDRLICEDCGEEFNELRDGLCGVCNVKADEAAGQIPRQVHCVACGEPGHMVCQASFPPPSVDHIAEAGKMVSRRDEAALPEAVARLVEAARDVERGWRSSTLRTGHVTVLSNAAEAIASRAPTDTGEGE